MKQELSTYDRLSKWLRQSRTLKLLTIGSIILILLIPSSMIQSIIYEREGLRSESVNSVQNTWAGQQVLCGPILSIPVSSIHLVDDKPFIKNSFVHILPQSLDVSVSVQPKTLKRGIYEVVVYNSQSSFKGSFDIERYLTDDMYHEVMWNKAFLTIGISDLRGIQSELKITWNDISQSVTAGSKIPDIVNSGVTLDVDLSDKTLRANITFEFFLDLQGSDEWSMIPLGSTTNLRLTSPWTSPSFVGHFLPDERNVNAEGFKAVWNLLELNRSFPQTWQGSSDYGINQSAFGVKLLLEMDDYKKSMRSAKYAVMTIGFTFLVFFLVEILNKRRIHPFQYTLVGLALCLFYILLVSITEHTSFDMAYIIASIIVILLISVYSLSIFMNRKISLALSMFLISVYGFVFVTLQLTNYALLIGSLGLTVIIGTTMYLTRNINWYE